MGARGVHLYRIAHTGYLATMSIDVLMSCNQPIEVTSYPTRKPKMGKLIDIWAQRPMHE